MFCPFLLYTNNEALMYLHAMPPISFDVLCTIRPVA